MGFDPTRSVLPVYAGLNLSWDGPLPLLSSVLPVYAGLNPNGSLFGDDGIDGFTRLRGFESSTV